MRYPVYNKLTSQDICVPIKHIYYIKDWNGLPVRISHSYTQTHTSSMRSLALPISSGIDSSLLLLTTRTRSGRLNRNLGSTDSWFRLENITAHTFNQLFTSGAQIKLQADGTQHKMFTKYVSSVTFCKFKKIQENGCQSISTAFKVLKRKWKTWQPKHASNNLFKICQNMTTSKMCCVLF